MTSARSVPFSRLLLRSVLRRLPVDSNQLTTITIHSSYPQSTNTMEAQTKLRAIEVPGTNCWSCWNVDPQFAHVISQEDRQIAAWRDAGLLPFSLESPDNCIALCAYCHSVFDQPSDPAWVFIPTDLRYFIQYEINDQQRLSRGDPPAHRVVPSADEYKAHQHQQGILPSEATGGLYRGYFLKDVLHGGRLPYDLLKDFAASKSWHGHPLASIRRAITLLGSCRVYILENTVIENLTTLRRLYFDHPRLINQKLYQIYRAPQERKRPRENEDEGDSGARDNEQKRHAGKNKDRMDDEHEDYSGAGGSGRERPPAEDRMDDIIERSEWVMGPETTSADDMKRFGPVFKSTNALKLIS